jgi:hypothetical protein
MRMQGVEPDIVLITDSFVAIPALVVGSDRVALMETVGLVMTRVR